MRPVIRTLLCALALIGAACGESTSPLGPPRCVVPNEYLVFLDDGVSNAQRATNALAVKHGFEVLDVYESLGGFAARMDGETALALKQEPTVAILEPNVCDVLGHL